MQRKLNPSKYSEKYIAPILLSGCICLTLSAPSYSNWDSSASVLFNAQASDNARLDFVEPEDTVELNERIDFTLTNDTRRSDFALSLAAEAVQYEGSDLLDDEVNAFASLRAKYIPRLRQEFGLNADYSSDHYIGNIRFAEDANDILPGENNLDGSLTVNQTELQIIRVRPYAQLELNRRVTGRLELHYTDYDYLLEADETRLFDFDDLDARINFSYAMSRQRRDKFAVELSHAEFDSKFPGGDGNTTRITATGAYSRDVSRFLRFSVAAGAVRADFENTAGEVTEPTFRVAATFRGRRYIGDLALSQFIRAGSTGRLIKSQNARFQYDYRLSQTQSVRLTTVWARGNRLTGLQQGEDFGYFIVAPRYLWQLGKRTSVNVQYAFRQRTDDSQADNTADANTLSVGIRYNFWGEIKD